MPRPSKGLIVIQDGLGDLPVAELGGRTPLEYADTPNMDRVAGSGVTGLMDILGPGIKVGTDIGHLALFGQNTSNRYFRRGPMEAAGAGYDLRPGQVALRINLATVDPKGRILDRRAGRIREEAAPLLEALNQIPLDTGIRFRFIHATEHRGVLVLEGPEVSPDISDTDPGDLLTGRLALPSRPLNETPAAARTARFVNQLVEASFELLSDHSINSGRINRGLSPANMILTRGAGSCQEFLNLPEATGLRIACVSAEATVMGIARLSGVTTLSASSLTANLDTDLSEKARLTIQALGEHDLVFLHLKGGDIAGHDRNPRLKAGFIEQTDAMLGQILSEIGDLQNLCVALVADHSTLSEVGEHSGDPVPVAVCGAGIPVDAVQRYGESFCRKGLLGRVLCRDFLDLIFEHLLSGEAFRGYERAAC